MYVCQWSVPIWQVLLFHCSQLFQIVYMYVAHNCIVMLEFRIEVHLHVVTCRHSGASVTLAVVSINIVHIMYMYTYQQQLNNFHLCASVGSPPPPSLYITSSFIFHSSVLPSPLLPGGIVVASHVPRQRKSWVNSRTMVPF